MSADLNTNRKQVDAQTAGANCQTYHHGFINPPGFVMEAYDAVGKWQTVEATTKAPLDLTVDIAMDGQMVHVTTPAELMAKRSRASPMAQRRYAEKWVSYAFEREGGPSRLWHGEQSGHQDDGRRLHRPQSDHRPHAGPPVPHPSRRSDAMNRRIFLRGIGGAAVAAPFLSSLHESKVRGQTTTAAAPRRLVVFFTHNGCLTNRWFPKVESGALTAAALAGTTLEGLTPYVSKLLVPRGFKSLNGYATTQTIDPHDQAMGSKLTCATINDDKTRYATAASLDYEIAKQINPGGKTPLVLSVGAASTNIKEVLSFGAEHGLPRRGQPHHGLQPVDRYLRNGGRRRWQHHPRGRLPRAAGAKRDQSGQQRPQAAAGPEDEQGRPGSRQVLAQSVAHDGDGHHDPDHLRLVQQGVGRGGALRRADDLLSTRGRGAMLCR